MSSSISDTGKRLADEAKDTAGKLLDSQLDFGHFARKPSDC